MMYSTPLAGAGVLQTEFPISISAIFFISGAGLEDGNISVLIPEVNLAVGHRRCRNGASDFVVVPHPA